MPTPAEVRLALADVKDPEFDFGIVDMGLIYQVDVEGDDRVRVLMTLTSPMCPHVETHLRDVRERIAGLPGVRSVDVELTFTPPWDPNTMASDDFKALVGIW